MTSALGMIVAQGIPLAPSLHLRLIALLIVEVVMVTTAVLLYVRWVQLKNQELDAWWTERRREGFSARTRALMEESERERRAAAGAAPPAERPATGGGPAMPGGPTMPAGPTVSSGPTAPGEPTAPDGPNATQ
jgi:hypothetical protein